jgi:EmrB/QacA subfamily drug resistance transporter
MTFSQSSTSAVPANTARCVRGTYMVLPAATLGSSLGFIDSSVVNVALPAIQKGLNADLATGQWVVNGYMLMLASLILLGGSAGDIFGQRRVFLIGLIGFAIASICCGLAPTAPWLVLARLLQGTAAALLVPSSLALIGSAYSGEARGKAIGTWAAAGALTTALGPPLGGWLVDTVGWRTIFFINIPIAAIAIFMALRIERDRVLRTLPTLDVKGAVLAVIFLGLLSFGLVEAGRGARFIGITAILCAIPVMVLFIIVERRSPAPMVPPSLFRSRDFSGANALTLVLYASLSGSLFLLPFVLINVHGYSAAQAGAAFLPFPIVMGAGSRWSGALAKRKGVRPSLIAGPAITGAGYALLALQAGNASYWTAFLPGLILIAVGMTITVAPLTTAVFDAAPDKDGGTASGINNAAARTGGLLAVAALGFAFGGSDVSALQPAALVGAYRGTMFAGVALAVLSAVVAWAAIGKQRAPVPV